MIKEAQDEYEGAKASVETVESAKIASEHFSSLLTNTEICLMQMKDAFAELERLYERPDDSVSKQRKALSNIMLKMWERKREDSGAAGTPAKEEKKAAGKENARGYKEKANSEELLRKARVAEEKA